MCICIHCITTYAHIYIFRKGQLTAYLHRRGLDYDILTEPVLVRTIAVDIYVCVCLCIMLLLLQVEGVFDPDVQIEKPEKCVSAYKFVTPEEEADQRAAELSGMAASAAGGRGAPIDGTPTPAAAPGPGKLHSHFTTAHELTADSQAAPVTPCRRRSVLESCNPQLLQAISQSIGGRGAHTPARHDAPNAATPAGESHPRVVLDSQPAVPTPATAPRDIQSKLLKVCIRMTCMCVYYMYCYSGFWASLTLSRPHLPPVRRRPLSCPSWTRSGSRVARRRRLRGTRPMLPPAPPHPPRPRPPLSPSSTRSNCGRGSN